MKTIGLVGGVASGKSRVAQMLVDLGAGLLDADRTGHEVLAEDPDVREAVRRRWGNAVLAPAGGIDRRAIASRVFADGEEAAADRRFLGQLLHPRIRERLEGLREELRSRSCPAAVLDAPLLLEAGWGPLCDVVVMIESPREIRLQRARQRGWTEAQFARREAAQWTVDEKRQHADEVILNDGSESRLRDLVWLFWQRRIVR